MYETIEVPFLKLFLYYISCRQCPGRYLGTTLYRMTLSLALRGGTWTRLDNSTNYGPGTAVLAFKSDPMTPGTKPSPPCPGMGWWRAQPARD